MRGGGNVVRVCLFGVGVYLAMVAAGVADLRSLSAPRGLGEATRQRAVTIPARLADLEVHTTTPGSISSSEQTIIECKLESGESTILTVVPEGTMVKKGEVICELDASAFAEMVRLQQITLNAARASFRQAQLDLDVNLIAVEEYRNGSMQQTLKSMKGNCALAQSDKERALDRLVWTQRMVDKGYQSISTLTAAETSLTGLELKLKQQETALRIFERYSAPIALKTLTRSVLTSKATLSYETLKLQWAEEKLALLKRQVELCTIRAPHDGFLTYYVGQQGGRSNSSYNIRVEEGVSVRRRQKMFYLPDLNKMEVAALIHQTVVRYVEPGMPAKVRVEALPGELMEGHVGSIAPLPTQDSNSRVTYFMGSIKLDKFPKGLKPGMTAAVDITTQRTPGALVIPAGAWVVEQGRGVCYVARTGQGQDRFERREIKLGQATRELLEVVEGLKEGERVLANPAQVLNPIVGASAGKPAKKPAPAKPSQSG
jgi:HlyD family secretion protein